MLYTPCVLFDPICDFQLKFIKAMTNFHVNNILLAQIFSKLLLFVHMIYENIFDILTQRFNFQLEHLYYEMQIWPE